MARARVKGLARPVPMLLPGQDRPFEQRTNDENRDRRGREQGAERKHQLVKEIADRWPQAGA